MQCPGGCGASDPRSSTPRCPTSIFCPGARTNKDYLSTYHPYLLEKRKVDTPFGVGVCMRDAFRENDIDSVDGSPDGSRQIAAQLSCPSSEGCRRKFQASKISIGPGACGRGYVVRSGTDYNLKPSVEEVRVAPNRKLTEDKPPQLLHNYETERAPSWGSGLNRPDKSYTTAQTGLCQPGFVVRVKNNTDDVMVTQNGKSQEDRVLVGLAALDVGKERVIRDDVATIREQLYPGQNRISEDVRGEVVNQKNIYSEAATAAQQNPPCSVAEARTAIERPALTLNSQQSYSCQIDSPVQLSPKESYTEYTSPTPDSTPCGCTNPHVSLSSLKLHKSSTDVTTTRDIVSDSGTDKPLKIGTNVRILAYPDVRQPSFCAGQPSFILAVITYVSLDGRYKLGTTKGIIGRLFAREELLPIDKKKISSKDVPVRSITVREASTTSFTVPYWR